MMPIAECCWRTRISKVKVEERGRKATFINNENSEYIKIKVDGCVIKNVTAADWVISRPSLGDLIIELKGRDVETAAKQVEATAVHWRTNQYCVGKLAGLIVSTQFPRFDTTIRKAKESFSKRFCGPLHVVTKNCEYDFEMVFSSKGPLSKP